MERGNGCQAEGGCPYLLSLLTCEDGMIEPTSHSTLLHFHFSMFFQVYIQIFSEKCMFINEDLDLIGNNGTTDIR
jgi:hypothetical protein